MPYTLALPSKIRVMKVFKWLSANIILLRISTLLFFELACNKNEQLTSLLSLKVQLNNYLLS